MLQSDSGQATMLRAGHGVKGRPQCVHPSSFKAIKSRPQCKGRPQC